MIPAINLYAIYSICATKGDYMHFVKLFSTWIENGWIPLYIIFKKSVGGCICLTELRNIPCVTFLVRADKWYQTILLAHSFSPREAEGEKVKVRSPIEMWVDYLYLPRLYEQWYQQVEIPMRVDQQRSHTFCLMYWGCMNSEINKLK